jgi:transcriptional regulator of acetoin/glycerol metabolism/AraC-like DNA-binding protein
MKKSEHCADFPRAFAQHVELANSVSEREVPGLDIDELLGSWRRCATKYRVDPADRKSPRILTSGELKDRTEPLGKLISSAQDEMNRLHKVVREAGYSTMLCDTAGVAVDHRSDAARASEFEYWGIWPGGVWSEDIEGTNGIGTCIAEERPITVHSGQHFRSRNTKLSCSGAPVFGLDGSLIAVLDVSAFDTARSEQAHALTGALTVNSAGAIEERFFREHFLGEWILAIAVEEERAPGMLLAVDGHQRVVGANRAARLSLMLDDLALQAGVSLWSIFERDAELFRLRDRSDIGTRLVFAGSNDSCAALVTPPVQATTAWHGAANIALHTRPRLDVIGSSGNIAPPRPPDACGGLSPGTLRRVLEYVEEHLDAPVDLATLAKVAGLSIHHFARGFKQSTGFAPHRYLTRKRVERAREMLAHTTLSLSEIASAVGFFDQSHLARHFRRTFGVTLGKFRWLRR